MLTESILKFFLLLTLFNCIPFSYAQKFTDVSIQRGILHNTPTTVGVVVFDVNNDGWDDLFIPGGYNADSTRLYINHQGFFSDATVSSGLNELNSNVTFCIAGGAGDLDNDGFNELIVTKYLCNSEYCNISIYRNNGNNTFTDITASSQIDIKSYNQSISFADVNQDGYLDIYVGTYRKGLRLLFDSLFNISGYDVDCFPNHLFINNKNMTFSEQTGIYGLSNNGCTFSSVFTDYDFDHDVDLLLANDFGEWNNFPNALFENNFPNTNFSSASTTSSFNQRIYGMGIATGDYDQDGDLDYYITNIGKNLLLRNNGNKTFTNVANLLGVENEWSVRDTSYQTSWGCNFLDADNDGDLDLFVASGWFSIDFPYTGTFSPNKLYLNDNGTFTDYSSSANIDNPLSKSGSAILDFNNDGKMDIICISGQIPRPNEQTDSSHTLLYENVSNNDKNWIKIKLIGTKNAKNAYGSRIEVYAIGKKQIQEVDGGGGSHSSQSTSYNHFGIDTASIIDSIKVYWLGGNEQTLKDVSINQVLNITEDTINILLKNNKTIKSSIIKVFPNPIKRFQKLTLFLDETMNPITSCYIYSIDGRLITQQYSKETQDDHKKIEIELPYAISENPGCYYILLNDKELNSYRANFIVLK